jgi:hypothetical protein
MKFTVSFDCEAAAFENDLEAAVAKVLRYVVRRVEEHSTLCQVIKDRNGNTIGRFQLVSE